MDRSLPACVETRNWSEHLLATFLPRTHTYDYRKVEGGQADALRRRFEFTERSSFGALCGVLSSPCWPYANSILRHTYRLWSNNAWVVGDLVLVVGIYSDSSPCCLPLTDSLYLNSYSQATRNNFRKLTMLFPYPYILFSQLVIIYTLKL